MLWQRVIGGKIGGIPNGTLTFLDHRNQLTGASITIAGADLGEESDNRIIIVGVATLNSRNPTAMTIAGISATEAVKTDVTGVVSSMWYAAVPTGTSGDIVITKPSDDTAVGWFAGYTSAPNPQDTGQYTGNGNASITIDSYAGGFMVWCQSDRSNQSTHTATWSGSGTATTDQELVVASNRSGSVGSVRPTTNVTNGTFTLSAGNDQNKVVLASWSK